MHILLVLSMSVMYNASSSPMTQWGLPVVSSALPKLNDVKKPLSEFRQTISKWLVNVVCLE